ncbi:hypothetical protein [Candidatus Weimeria sp. HCP3S3_B5]
MRAGIRESDPHARIIVRPLADGDEARGLYKGR